jgi:hypothetical protein
MPQSGAVVQGSLLPGRGALPERAGGLPAIDLLQSYISEMPWLAEGSFTAQNSGSDSDQSDSLELIVLSLLLKFGTVWWPYDRKIALVIPASAHR